MMKIATSLRSAPTLVLQGKLNPDDVFVISQNIATNEQELQKLLDLYHGSWGNLSNECEKLVRCWFANGHVFQYRLIQKPKNDHSNGLWKYRYDCEQYHLNVDYAGAQSYYENLDDYLNAQKDAGCGAWIEYLGIKSEEDIKRLATVVH